MEKKDLFAALHGTNHHHFRKDMANLILCKTCRYWKTTDGKWGYCIPTGTKPDTGQEPACKNTPAEARAVGCNYSGAILYTIKDFHCASWKAKIGEGAPYGIDLEPNGDPWLKGETNGKDNS